MSDLKRESRKPPPIFNAKKKLPLPLFEKVVEAMAKSGKRSYGSRRITFNPLGSDPTPSEKWISAQLRNRCREHLDPYLPIRLYFNVKSPQLGRKELPFKAEATKMSKAGHRLEAIAAFYGCNTNTLRNWGLKQPRKKHQRTVKWYTRKAFIEEGARIVSGHIGITDGDLAAALLKIQAHYRHDTPEETEDFLARVGLLSQDLKGRENKRQAALKYAATKDKGQ